MATKLKAYHCDGYYFDKVCPSRGNTDPGDIRYDQEGWAKHPREFCLTCGISPLISELCPHCVEHKKWFRQEGRVLTGRVVEVTNFQVKEEGTARTIKAFTTMKSVKRFLAKPETNNAIVYGVEVNSGVLISPPIKR